MDDFRKQQRMQCGQAKGIRDRGPYGCDCCNRGSLRHRKITQRQLARIRFRREMVKQVNDE